MQRVWNLLKKLFCLPPVPTLLVAIPSFALVIYALSAGNEPPVITYTAYFLSAYALVITVTGALGIGDWLRKGIMQNPLTAKILSIPLLRRYFGEVAFRTEASLYQGLFVNLAYASVKFFSGIWYRSVWFGALAGYYILLAVMRFILLHYVRGRRQTGEKIIFEWNRYRLCGIILLLMNQTLAGIIILVVYQNSGFEYPGILIYIMALYTFYAAITAVMNVIKFRKYGSPVLSAAKAISLTAALVSVLSLETAMLTQFGAAEDAGFRRSMTGATGAGICIIVLGMAVYMIGHSTRQMRLLNEDNESVAS